MTPILPKAKVAAEPSAHCLKNDHTHCAKRGCNCKCHGAYGG